MTDHTNTYPDLVNVEDWLNAKGYTGEAGACHQAMSLIRKQEKRIAELEAALKLMIDTQDEWEKGVSKVIGKQPSVFNRAIDIARAVLEKKDG